MRNARPRNTNCITSLEIPPVPQIRRHVVLQPERMVGERVFLNVRLLLQMRVPSVRRGILLVVLAVRRFVVHRQVLPGPRP